MVEYTVVKNQVHISLEIRLVLVAIHVQFTSDRPEIHGVLHNRRVVEQSMRLVVDRVIKK